MGSTNTLENAQPSTSDITYVLHQLTEGISCQNERIEETNKLARQEFDIKKEKYDGKKDRISKLHSSFLNIFLNSSSTDGDRAAKDITAVYRSFLNQETEGLANQQFSVLFRELGFPDVGFSHGFFQAFLSGNFLYPEPGCPNNFSIFYFYEKLHDALDNKRCLLMHLK